MNKTRIMAIVACAFWLVFTVSLILYFIDPKNVVVSILTLSSGIIGAILYFIVRVMQKETTYPMPDDQEPNEEEPNGEEPNGEEPNEEEPNEENAGDQNPTSD